MTLLNAFLLKKKKKRKGKYPVSKLKRKKYLEIYLWSFRTEINFLSYK